MKPDTVIPESKPARIPLWLKIAYTAFMAVLIPVYWSNYGPGNFLYFCDLALLLTLAGMWLESSALISMCCVGICRRRCGAQISLWNCAAANWWA